MERGYIKVWRKLEDSGLLQMPNTLALFMYILMKATHKDKKMGTPTGVIELKRGQFISGRKSLAINLEQSEREIRTSLDRLVNLQILTIETTNRFSIYTIEKYNEYQDSDQQTTNERPAERPTNDQQTTTEQAFKNISTSLRSVDMPKKERARKTQFPDNFTPCETAVSKLKAAAIPVSEEINRFRDYCKANSKTYSDWSAAFRNWASNAVAWKPKPSQTAPPRQMSAVERQEEMARQMFGGAKNGSGRVIDISQD